MSVILFLLSVAQSHSEDLFSSKNSDSKMIILEKGEEAPYDGTLLNSDAMADVLIKLKYADKECSMLVEKEVNLMKVQSDTQKKISEIFLQSCYESSTLVADTKNEQIDYLTEELSKKKGISSVGWYALGIASGIGVTAVAGWSLGQISQ